MMMLDQESDPLPIIGQTDDQIAHQVARFYDLSRTEQEDCLKQFFSHHHSSDAATSSMVPAACAASPVTMDIPVVLVTPPPTLTHPQDLPTPSVAPARSARLSKSKPSRFAVYLPSAQTTLLIAARSGLTVASLFTIVFKKYPHLTLPRPHLYRLPAPCSETPVLRFSLDLQTMSPISSETTLTELLALCSNSTLPFSTETPHFVLLCGTTIFSSHTTTFSSSHTPTFSSSSSSSSSSNTTTFSVSPIDELSQHLVDHSHQVNTSSNALSPVSSPFSSLSTPPDPSPPLSTPQDPSPPLPTDPSTSCDPTSSLSPLLTFSVPRIIKLRFSPTDLARTTSKEESSSKVAAPASSRRSKRSAKSHKSPATALTNSDALTPRSKTKMVAARSASGGPQTPVVQTPPPEAALSVPEGPLVPAGEAETAPAHEEQPDADPLQATPRLRALLASEVEARLFELALHRMHSEENLAFLRDSLAYRSEMLAVREDFSARLLAIVEKYLSSASLSRINLDNFSRNRFFEQLAQDPHDPFIFDEAIAIVAALLEQDSLRRFELQQVDAKKKTAHIVTVAKSLSPAMFKTFVDVLEKKSSRFSLYVQLLLDMEALRHAAANNDEQRTTLSLKKFIKKQLLQEATELPPELRAFLSNALNATKLSPQLLDPVEHCFTTDIYTKIKPMLDSFGALPPASTAESTSSPSRSRGTTLGLPWKASLKLMTSSSSAETRSAERASGNSVGAFGLPLRTVLPSGSDPAAAPAFLGDASSRRGSALEIKRNRSSSSKTSGNTSHEI